MELLKGTVLLTVCLSLVGGQGMTHCTTHNTDDLLSYLLQPPKPTPSLGIWWKVGGGRTNA